MTDTAVALARQSLDPDALRELREGFRGEIIEPDHAHYDDARVVFNGMFDRRPAVILRPTGTADVIRALGLAKASGAAVRDPRRRPFGRGLLVLRRRDRARPERAVRASGSTRRSAPRRAQGGVNWGSFDRETQQFGLAVTGGRVTTTGVAGFTTGSGSGWLERKYGFACDNLISADVVTADGEVVVANDKRERRPVLGPQGRRRQLRRDHRARVQPAPCWADRLRRSGGVRPREGPRGDQHLARPLRRRTGRARLGGRVGRRAAGAVRAGAVARQADVGDRRPVRRLAGRRREGARADAGARARSSTCSSRCRTR